MHFFNARGAIYNDTGMAHKSGTKDQTVFEELPCFPYNAVKVQLCICILKEASQICQRETMPFL